MRVHSGRSWGPAAQRTVDVGEGDPERWTALGLRAPDDGELDRLGAAAGLVAALRSPLAGGADGPAAAVSVAGHPCIGRSGGDPAQLPVSVVWEALLALGTARTLDVPCVLTLSVYEEQVQQPANAGAFLDMGHRLRDGLELMGRRAGVRTEVRVAADPPREELPLRPPELYGLYTPFGEGRYPSGFPHEAAVLRAFAAYCARYTEEGLTVPGTWAADGIHLARAALLGLPPRSGLLAMVPLPDPHDPRRLLQDAPAGVRVTMARADELPTDWWPEESARRLVGSGFRDLARTLAADLRVSA